MPIFNISKNVLLSRRNRPLFAKNSEVLLAQYISQGLWTELPHVGNTMLSMWKNFWFLSRLRCSKNFHWEAIPYIKFSEFTASNFVVPCRTKIFETFFFTRSAEHCTAESWQFSTSLRHFLVSYFNRFLSNLIPKLTLGRRDHLMGKKITTISFEQKYVHDDHETVCQE